MSVVGKYRYFMHSPAEQDRAPVVVDIILVGRTKIITLHSGIWLENEMDRKISFRLHIPISPLVAPGQPGRDQERNNDRMLGPLKPKEGTFSGSWPQDTSGHSIVTLDPPTTRHLCTSHSKDPEKEGSESNFFRSIS